MIEHDRDLQFEYATVATLSPLIRRVVCRNPGPFTFMGTGTYIVGRGSVAVIDPGPELEEHLDALDDSLEPGERVSHVLVTHTHSDHSTAAPRVAAKAGVSTFGFGPHGEIPAADPEDRVDFSAYFEPGELEALAQAYDEMDPALKFEGPDVEFVPDIVLGDSDVVEGDGWTIEAVWTPGHCSNHLCFAVREERTLFTGDHVMAWATSVIGPPDGSMGDYLASLRKLLGRDDATYWPTHGPAVTDPGTYVRALLTHREDRETQILALLGDTPTGIADMVPTLYAGYDRLLWYPAAASVHAHLLGLVHSDRVVVDGGGPAKLSSSYRLAT